MARTAGGGAPIVIAAPAHWGMSTIGALSAALRGKPGLAAATSRVSDAAAALAGLKAGSGLPGSRRGGTLRFRWQRHQRDHRRRRDTSQIGETVRYPEFSGDLVDQALLNHVIAGISESSDADPAGTAAVGSLSRCATSAGRPRNAFLVRDGNVGQRQPARLRIGAAHHPPRSGCSNRHWRGCSPSCRNPCSATRFRPAS